MLKRYVLGWLFLICRLTPAAFPEGCAEILTPRAVRELRTSLAEPYDIAERTPCDEDARQRLLDLLAALQPMSDLETLRDRPNRIIYAPACGLFFEAPILHQVFGGKVIGLENDPRDIMQSASRFGLPAYLALILGDARYPEQARGMAKEVDVVWLRHLVFDESLKASGDVVFGSARVLRPGGVMITTSVSAQEQDAIAHVVDVIEKGTPMRFEARHFTNSRGRPIVACDRPGMCWDHFVSVYQKLPEN